MPRIINPEAHAAKRTEIVKAAMALILSKGYEQMTIRDILDGLGISKGAFYHYFDSKAGVVEAFIEQIHTTTEAAMLPVLRDPDKSAIEKLQGFFDGFDRLRADNMSFVVSLGSVWYGDVNALVRQKVESAVRQHRAPLLAEIVRQGVREELFFTEHPEESGEIIMSLIQGMARLHGELLWQVGAELDVKRCSERIATSHAAYMNAIERILGAPTRSLYRVDKKAVSAWLRAARAATAAKTS